MRLLLDTHALLWYATAEDKLTAAAEAVNSDPQNDVFVSPASYWELSIKINIGKYQLAVPFEQFLTHAIDGNQFEVIPIEPRHVVELSTLPHHHRDPFDRLLIAQAMAERMPIVSSDAAFDAYPVARVW